MIRSLSASRQWRRYGRRPGAIILRYHRIGLDAERVADPMASSEPLARSAGDPAPTVHPERFAQQLEALQDSFRPLGLEHLVDSLAGDDRLPVKGVALTLDDGTADHLEQAAPLLERFDFPATVFVITGKLGAEGYLSSEGVVKLAGSGLVDIGAHTVTHPVLPALPAPARRLELTESKRALEELLGRQVRHFAFPFGRTSDSTELVRAAGYASACTTRPGVVHEGADPFRLPRLFVGDWDGDELLRRLPGLPTGPDA